MFQRITNWLKDEQKESQVKAAMYYLVCQVLVKGIGFVTTPIFSRLLTKEEYGCVSNFLAWEGVLFPIITLNLRASINKSKYDYYEENDNYLATILTFSVLTVSVFYAMFEMNVSLFVSLFGMDAKYIRMLFIYILFLISFDYQQIQYNIFRKYKLYVLYTISYVVATLLLSVLLVYFMPDRLLGRLLGLVGPTVVIGGLIYGHAFKRGRKISGKYLRYALTVSLPLLPSALSANVLSVSDRIMITNYCGTSDTAMYSIPYTVAGIATIVFTALNQAWAPWLLDNLKLENYGSIKKRAMQFSGIYACLIIMLMLVSPEVVMIIGGEKYASTVNVMPPVILGMVCQYLYSFYFDTEYFFGETIVISLGTFLAAGVNVLLNAIFLPRYGYIAAAYTTFAGYFVMLIYHFCIVKFKIRKSYVFSNIWFAVIFVVLVVAQIFIVQIYEYPIIRLFAIAFFIVIALIIAYKNRTEITKIVRKK